MSAFLLKWKRIAGMVAGVLSVTFTFSAFFYAKTIEGASAVGTERNFYFLVAEGGSVEVSTQTIGLQGGAGYSLLYEDGVYAAYSVYFSEDESKVAQGSVEKTGEHAEIVVVTSKPLYLKTEKQKKHATTISGAFESLYGCMQVLHGEIARLERGATQESSKRILQTLSRQFSFLAKEYEKTIAGYKKACKNAEERLLEVTKGVVYAKDLRYILCELSVAYANLSKNFSL